MVLIFNAWLYAKLWINPPQSQDFIIINNSSKQTTLSLHKDKTIKIRGNIGISFIEIKNKQVRFIRSPCKNKTCILNGWMTKSLPFNACLPNKISIKFANNTDFDAINY